MSATGTPGRGKFITLEGGEGAGKSTQARLLADHLRSLGHDCVVTREPGGSPVAEALRQAILSGVAAPLGPSAEAVLFAAARIDHVAQTIMPALARGAFVVCDRFADSTRVYQGALGDVDPDLFEAEGLSYHEGLKAAFLDIAKGEPGRCAVVDAANGPDEVAKAIWAVVQDRLGPMDAKARTA